MHLYRLNQPGSPPPLASAGRYVPHPAPAPLLELPPQTAPSVVTIGSFDGVHLGHQALIRKVVQAARQQGMQSVLLTFDPHPQAVLSPNPPALLTSLAQRLALFDGLGLDLVGMIPFSKEMAGWPPETFLQAYLFDRFEVGALWVGYDFAFGKGRAGNPQMLRGVAQQKGFGVEVVEAVKSQDGEIISSTRIRQLLAQAQFDQARALLGHSYSIERRVVTGAGKGRQLGFPTLNLNPEGVLPLPYGVFAFWARVIAAPLGESQKGFPGEWVPAVGNYGLRPTVTQDMTPVLEVHLLEGHPDWYDHVVEVVPMRQMRGEKRFESLEALKTQVHRDMDEARRWLLEAPTPG